MILNFSVMEKKKNIIINKLLTGIFIGIAIFSLFFFWGDFQSVKKIIFSIKIQYILLSILSTLLSYFFRFLKWHYFLRFLKTNVNFRDSLNIFFIGLSMSITPGKIGELLKSYLLKNISGIEILRSAPVVFVDRLTDIFAMVALVSLGISVFSLSFFPIIVVFGLLVIVVIVLQYRQICYKFINVITNIKFLSKYRTGLGLLYESIYDLLKYRLVIFAILVSIVAWFMECMALFILTNALGLELGLLENIFVFSFGTIAGALSMLPGGLGVAEGSITTLLMHFNIDKSTAVSITLLIRLVTLWLGVIIGLLIFFKKRKDYMI